MVFRRLFSSFKKSAGQPIVLDASNEAELAPNPDFLFQAAPNVFWKIMGTEDDKARFKALGPYFVHDVLLCEILRYGIHGREDMISPLRTLYAVTEDAVPVERRVAMLRHVFDLMDHLPLRTNVWFPFIVSDSNRLVVATAVMDYLSLAAATNNDPMSRPRDIVRWSEVNNPANRGAIFGALLHVGDSRVCELLWPLKGQLSEEELAEAVQCATGFFSSAAVEFELRWLEEMDKTLGAPLFGTVAAGLINQRKTMTIPEVATGLRPFPSAHLSPEEHLASIRRIPIDEYTKTIAPRLYALEQAEPPPRVMPHVLKAWGLTPTSSPEQTASF